jgi:hypothetical protein
MADTTARQAAVGRCHVSGQKRCLVGAMAAQGGRQVVVTVRRGGARRWPSVVAVVEHHGSPG